MRAAALGRGGLEIFDNELNDPGDCVRDPVQRQAASLGDSVLRSGPERFRVRPGDTGVHAGGLWLTLRSLAAVLVKASEFGKQGRGLGCANLLEYP